MTKQRRRDKESVASPKLLPLFCTLAQTGQVLDVLHRPGNVHDSNGAQAFVLECIGRLREALPGVKIELRMDSAFFSREMAETLHAHRV